MSYLKKGDSIKLIKEVETEKIHLILSDIASKVKNRIKLYYFYKKMVKNL